MRLLLLAVAGVLAWSAAWAAVYEWTDSRGVVHMTDDPANVPATYRSTMKTRDIDTREATPPASTPESETIGTPMPPPEEAESYSGHDRGWWQSRFHNVRQQLQTLRDQIADKKNTLTELHRRRVLYQKPSDRVAYFDLADEITRDEERAGALQKQLDKLEWEADGAGVPREWRE